MIVEVEGDAVRASHDGQRCSDAVHRMLQRLALATEGTAAPAQSHGPAIGEASHSLSPPAPPSTPSSSLNVLNDDELSLLLHWCRIDDAASFAAVEGEELQSLVQELERLVVHASGARVLDSALRLLHHHNRERHSSPTHVAAAVDQWLKHQGAAHFAALTRGLEAAQVVLALASAPRPGEHRRIVHEGAVEAAAALARSHLARHLVPSLNRTAHLAVSAVGTVPTPSPNGNKSPSLKRSPLHGPSRESNKRRSTETGTATVTTPSTLASSEDLEGDSAVTERELTKVYHAVLSSTLDAHLALLDRLQAALDGPTFVFEDQHVLMITGAMLTTLELDATAASASGPAAVWAVQRLQGAAISVLTAVFRRYPAHRVTLLLDDLVTALPKLPPPHRKSMQRTYPVSYSSVEHGQRLEAWNLGLLRSAGIGVAASSGPRGQHFVQMLSALLVSLALAGVERPRYVSATGKEEGEGPRVVAGDEATSTPAEHGEPALQYQPGLKACQHWADAFCAKLLQRCSGKQGSFDYRLLLSCLIDDWLSLWLIPEYTAAEVWLVAALRRLKHAVLQASPAYAAAQQRSPPPKAATEPSCLNAEFDVLGKLVAMQARILAECRAKPLRPAPQHLLESKHARKGRAPSEDNAPQLECYCNGSSADMFQVFCDSCSFAFHGSCVGLSRDRIPDLWHCDACKLGQNLKHIQSQLYCSDHHLQEERGDVLDDAYALEHAYISHVAHREGLARVREITRFHLARCTDRLATAASKSDDKQPPVLTDAALLQKLITRLLDHWEGPGGPASQLLSEEGTIRLIASTMGLTSPFLAFFPAHLNTLLRLLGDEVHALRKLSLKAIEKIVEADPDLMFQKNIIRAVSRRLSDDQISVREAALSLVGAYMTKSPDVASSFQESVLACLSDAGVSVRKRCIRIFQDLLAVNPCFRGRTDVCSALVQHAANPKEEDGVRDLIHDLFLQLWLQDGEKVVASSYSSLSATSTLSPSLIQLPPTARLMTRSDVAALQMMEVVRVCHSADDLETLLRELLHGAEDNDKGRKQSERKKRAALARSKCDLLVTALFELLISIQERQAASLERLANDLAATLQTICIFAVLAPDAVLRRLDTVLPYLKADNGVSTADERVIVTATCNIIHRLTSSCGSETASRSVSIAGDLADVAYKCGSSAVEAAIRALSSLAKHQDAAEKGDFALKLLQVSRKFYSYLANKSTTQDFTADKIRHNIHRALAALGFVCEYHETKCHTIPWEDEVLSGSLELIADNDFTWETNLLACYRVFRVYLGKSDVPTKCAALRALAGMFVSQPRLMLVLEQDCLIEEVMSDTADQSLQLTALQCWRRILLGEEKRVDGGLAKAMMDSDGTITTAKRISGDQDGDSSLFGGILTNHANRLFALTQARSPGIRLASLELIGVLLKQGQVNPNDAVPFLFALQGEIESTDISALSLSLLMTEGEKRPDMLRQRICAGVKKAFAFQRTIYPSKPASALKAVQRVDAVTQECIFGLVFKECVARIRKQRLGIYSNLLALFELPDSDDEASHTPKSLKKAARESTQKQPTKTIDVALLSFVAQILAHLPYEASGDPLYIIHKITSNVWLQGSQLLDRFASLLRPIGLASSDEMDDANAAEDALERAARAKFPSRTQEAKALLSPQFDLQGFSDLCWMGDAITLQLRLKSFLRRLYNLSDVRCLAYDPNAKESGADRAISKSTAPMVFDGTTDSYDFRAARVAAGSAALGPVDLDRLLSKYAELRRLMREEIVVTADGAGRGDIESDGCASPLRDANESPSPPTPQPETRSTRSSSFRCRTLLKS